MNKSDRVNFFEINLFGELRVPHFSSSLNFLKQTICGSVLKNDGVLTSYWVSPALEEFD